VRDHVAGLLRDVEPFVLVMEKRSGKHGRCGAHRARGAGEHRGKGAYATGDHRGSKAKKHRRRGALFNYSVQKYAKGEDEQKERDTGM
jgi:hypothetical protein